MALALGDCEKDRFPVMKDRGDIGYFLSCFELRRGDFERAGERPLFAGERERPLPFFFSPSDGVLELDNLLLLLLNLSRNPLFGVETISWSSSSASLPEIRELA